MNLVISPWDIWKRVKYVVTSPHGVWSDIRRESKEWKEVLLTYNLPLSLLSCALLLVKMAVFGVETNIGRFSTLFIPTLLFCIACTFLAPLLLLFMSQAAIFMAARLGQIVTLDETVRLIGYAATPLYLLPIAAMIPMSDTLQSLVLLSSVYLAAFGSGPLLGLTRENQIIFGIGVLLTSILLSISLLLFVKPWMPLPAL